MGLFRKLTSISTLGAVDFKSDKERTATYTRQSRDALRAANSRQALADARAARDKAKEASARADTVRRASQVYIASLNTITARMHAGEITPAEAMQLMAELKQRQAGPNASP